MKLESFFKKFDQLADAPDAVAKMRALVRHLAVTGKLVDQDPSDESGEILLKKINAERLAAVKARQISPMKPLPVVGEGEQLFYLQPGWVAARLLELVMEIQTGPFGSSLHKSDYRLGGTPVINPASLKDGKIVPIDEMAIGAATYERLEVFKLIAGDIVMARRGEMGRCAIVTPNEEGWLCGTGSLVLRMPRSLYAPFLAMLIGAPMARAYLGGASVGTTMQNLNQSILAKMPVGVPPLAEQNRIVAKVDELMALCDRLEAQQQERETRHVALARASLARFAGAPTPANLEFLFHKSYTISPADLRKSILTLAVKGKLVPQDPDEEPAEKLLGRVLLEKKRLIDKGIVRRDQVREDGEELQPSFDIPQSWTFSTLAEIGVINPRNDADPNSDASFVPMRLINAEWAEPHSHEIKKWAEIRSGFPHFGEGDVTLAKITPCFENRKSAVMLNLVNGIGAGTTELHVVRPILVDPKYVLIFLKSPEFVESGIPRMSGTAGQKRVPTWYFATAPLPLPPLAEQHRIVAKVDQLMALVDGLETQLAAARATAANLLDAVVSELTFAA